MNNTEKYYTREHISKEFDKLTLKEKIKILYEALDAMQAYNGRSKFNCIAGALGYDNYEGEHNTYTKSELN